MKLKYIADLEGEKIYKDELGYLYRERGKKIYDLILDKEVYKKLDVEIPFFLHYKWIEDEAKKRRG